MTTEVVKDNENNADATNADEGNVPLDKDEMVQKLILKNVAISMGIGLIPLPLLDVAAILGQQLYMIAGLGKIYDEKFSHDLGRKSILSLLGATAPQTSLKYVVFSVLKSLPGVGQTVSILTMPILSGATTYAVGKVFHMHFASGGTFLSFDPARYRQHFQEQLAAGLKVAKEEAEQQESNGADA